MHQVQRVPVDLQQLLVRAHELRRAGRLDEVAATYEKILALQPNFAEVHNDLGIVLCAQEKFDEAQRHFQRAIALRPGLAQAHSNLGNIFGLQRKFDRAVAHYRQALALNPNDTATLHELGKVQKDQGQLEEALASFDRALALNPHYAEAHYNRSALKTFRPGDADLAALEALAAGNGRVPADKMFCVHFALGKALEDVGQYDRAFEHWTKANALKRREIVYDEAATRQLHERIVRVFDAELLERFATAGDPSPAPIFVLGMSRSGSTLVEQILASHPAVHGGGELTNLGIVANGAADAAGRPIAFPVYVPQLGPNSLCRLGQTYLAGLPVLPGRKMRITDKTPGNFLYAGLIRMALPGAKIIHTVRDPVDTCLSCFTNFFTYGLPFTYDLAELGRYYCEYSKLMDHWRRVLPAGSMLEVRYEEVVGDLEGQARRMLDFCGLPWDPACLSFHKTQRPVSTASNVQVRQPLYRGSVERSRRYEKHLGPLLAELAACRTPE